MYCIIIHFFDSYFCGKLIITAFPFQCPRRTWTGHPRVRGERHTYTPHSCRYTFTKLMKCVDAASKDKLKLIGHSSEEMLYYYRDVNIDDLRKITDGI